jgi:hypothetical protein
MHFQTKKYRVKKTVATPTTPFFKLNARCHLGPNSQNENLTPQTLSCATWFHTLRWSCMYAKRPSIFIFFSIHVLFLISLCMILLSCVGAPPSAHVPSRRRRVVCVPAAIALAWGCCPLVLPPPSLPHEADALPHMGRVVCPYTELPLCHPLALPSSRGRRRLPRV